ncbi:hypothetical protein [Streptomyces sp. GESEQ-35]|uniref:tautomerase family protein n=1 Tax=Streptomyces sp. GESEQ-35 TaxID=2812657 RepID=UPI001B339214|nr:hypothetical protein [Streptomyces sp. GESEQ-35]
MPLIDVMAAAGTFADKQTLAQDLARTLMHWEQVPEIPFFSDNTAAFIHDLEPAAISTAAGAGNHVRVQVTTNAGALNREQQLGVVAEITALIARAAQDPGLADRTWVALCEAVEGGWGIAGHAYTNPEIVQTARRLLGKE